MLHCSAARTSSDWPVDAAHVFHAAKSTFNKRTCFEMRPAMYLLVDRARMHLRSKRSNLESARASSVCMATCGAVLRATRHVVRSMVRPMCRSAFLRSLYSCFPDAPALDPLVCAKRSAWVLCPNDSARYSGRLSICMSREIAGMVLQSGRLCCRAPRTPFAEGLPGARPRRAAWQSLRAPPSLETINRPSTR
jgi:hypothetical protein